MKKIIRLTESDLARIVKRVIQEGNIEKSSKEKDLDVKMENFRDKIRDFLKSKDCKVKQVGTDFEVHCDGEHVGQVMFRRNAITIKKEGNKFGKDFKFNEMGEIKSELSKIVKPVIKETNDEFDDDSVMDNNFNQEEYDELLDQAREFLCREIGLEEDEVYDMSEDQIIGEIKYYDKGLYRRLEELKYSKPVDLDEPYDSIGGYSVNDLRRAFNNIRKTK